MRVSVAGVDLQKETTGPESRIVFFVTLLFPLVAFRASLPGKPPMGTLCNHISFVCGSAVAIIAIGIVTVVWLKRVPPGDRPWSQ